MPGEDHIAEKLKRVEALPHAGERRLDVRTHQLDVQVRLLRRANDGASLKAAGVTESLQEIVRAYQDGLRRELALGVANELSLPVVPLSDLHGDAAAFLDRAASCSPAAPIC